MILELLIFGSSIFIHELGHYLAYRFFGIKPKVYLKHLFIFVDGGEKETLFQSFIIGWTGILLGLIPLFFIAERYLLIYLVACFIDFTRIYEVWNLITEKKISKDAIIKDFKTIYKGKVIK